MFLTQAHMYSHIPVFNVCRLTLTETRMTNIYSHKLSETWTRRDSESLTRYITEAHGDSHNVIAACFVVVNGGDPNPHPELRNSGSQRGALPVPQALAFIYTMHAKELLIGSIHGIDYASVCKVPRKPGGQALRRTVCGLYLCHV